MHPLTGRELRALRRLQREQESKSPFVFVSERGAPFSNRGFQAMVERVARAAGFDMKIHPHMLPKQRYRSPILFHHQIHTSVQWSGRSLTL
jgi:site-specific recombinase XerC